jgi:ribosomal protein S18 acetylase RimI-like enzyme
MKIYKPGGGKAEMEFREAVLSDLNGILDLYPQLNPENARFPTDSARLIWDQILSNPAYRYFVAVDGGKIVASCNITLVSNLTMGCRPFAVIENVVTDNDYRGRGIGTKIIEMAVSFAKKSDCYKVMLLSSVKRTDAHAFYEKLGFNGTSKKGFEMRFP